jgi:hypothetical protein
LIGKASEHWDEEKASRMQKPNLLGNPPVNESVVEEMSK